MLARLAFRGHRSRRVVKNQPPMASGILREKASVAVQELSLRLGEPHRRQRVKWSTFGSLGVGNLHEPGSSMRDANPIPADHRGKITKTGAPW
jgi:hypothetical protein